MTFPLSKEQVPYITTAQMIEVDRAMIEDYKIGLIQMMENAGRNLAHLARTHFLKDSLNQKPIRVCYPAVAIRDRRVFVFGVSDIVEPRNE